MLTDQTGDSRMVIQHQKAIKIIAAYAHSTGLQAKSAQFSSATAGKWGQSTHSLRER
jgi:hypothetical protein